MPSSGKPAAPKAATSVVRLVVREIVPGDRRKFTATSNDVDTGGGARDLRFRPEEKFRPVFARMFPSTKLVRAKRDGVETRIQINVGEVRWRDASDPGRPPVERSGEAEIWPPTTARPREMRLIRVHRYGFTSLLPPVQGEGKSVMMLIQEAQGVVRVRFTTERSIREGNWHRLIKPFLLRWLESNSRSGFLDLESGEEFPQ